MRALIIGASRGIGAALLAQGQTRGHEVVGTSRSGDLALDVTDPAAQAKVAAETGAIDLLVCNAGVFLDRKSTIRTITQEELTQTFAVNVTGVALTVQAQLPNLSRGGRIAIISSQMGSAALARGGGYAYRTSKAAAINLGLNLAAELEGEGIAVGIYHPGWVQTDMGGKAASLTPEASASGLWDRFEALTLANTGKFENFDGQPHPI